MQEARNSFDLLAALLAVFWQFPCLLRRYGSRICWHLTVIIRRAGLRGNSPWVGLSSFIFTGIFEESLLRGYLQYTLTRGIGFWWTAIILSTTFGAMHGSNPGESPVGLFSAAAIGLVFCLSLWYTGSLWWAIGFHAAWDWGETYFYGTSDSGMIAQGHFFSEHPTGTLLWTGGATGPEGSLLIVPLILLMALLMWLWWSRRVESPFKKSAPAVSPRILKFWVNAHLLMGGSRPTRVEFEKIGKARGDRNESQRIPHRSSRWTRRCIS